MKTTWAQLQMYMNTYIALKALSPITDSRAPHVIFIFLLPPSSFPAALLLPAAEVELEAALHPTPDLSERAATPE